MTDEEHEHVMEFSEEFARLVRKYMPDWPITQAQANILALMQDQTSCYSPYVWGDEFRPTP